MQSNNEWTPTTYCNYGEVHRVMASAQELKVLGVSGVAQRVLGCIASRINRKTGISFPSIPTIASETSFHRRTVQRAINSLIRAGVLEVDDGGGRESNKYRLLDVSFVPASERHRCQSDTAAASESHSSGVRVTRQQRQRDALRHKDNTSMEEIKVRDEVDRQGGRNFDLSESGVPGTAEASTEESMPVNESSDGESMDERRPRRRFGTPVRPGQSRRPGTLPAAPAAPIPAVASKDAKPQTPAEELAVWFHSIIGERVWERAAAKTQWPAVFEKLLTDYSGREISQAVTWGMDDSDYWSKQLPRHWAKGGGNDSAVFLADHFGELIADRDKALGKTTVKKEDPYEWEIFSPNTSDDSDWEL